MSEESQNNDFELFEKINKKYFLELEQNVPHIQQTLFDLQNEYYKLWKNYVTSQLSLQKEFFNKSGLDYSFPDTAKDIIENMSDETIKFRSILHKMTIAHIEQGKNYAKTLNDNSNIFTNLNRKILQNWISMFKTNQNS
ncbi:hypothetical protein SCCGRSA3_01582 [Marine Group I thaumarchaeote SCGC RSA3]|uniref:Uncharacterized protein n=2 Tax=Marine Group I TaxID=905826 RepID=A0A081RPS5_9ARCH|nr:hypothetical protein AAA799N04_00148 [Marine Group I thaumarchaeote SCGC AAA799-N04]KFM17652.1 hypothetical protein SCCGRSA3_01582 [Marine Group I thaumarchaeote SCGC RSA3]